MCRRLLGVQAEAEARVAERDAEHLRQLQAVGAAAHDEMVAVEAAAADARRTQAAAAEEAARRAAKAEAERTHAEERKGWQSQLAAMSAAAQSTEEPSSCSNPPLTPTLLLH